MEATAALLRATQIKKRLAGVTTLLELLQTQADETASETLASLLVDVLPCLKDHNFKVAVTSLEILSLLLPRVGGSTLRGVFKTLWLSLVERLGDSKLQVREKAVDVVVVLTDLVGISAVFERLKPCVRHKNWRTREQTVHALWRCLEHHNQMRAMKNAVLDEIVMLLEDSAKEVRDAAMLGLEKMYEHIGASLMYDLESKNIRSGHMKTLTEKLGGGQPAVQEHQEIPVRYNPVQKVDAPLSSTARFLDAIKNKQYNFENVPTSNTAAMNNPSQSFEPTPPASPECSPSPEPVLAVEPVPVSGISDRDVQRELAKLQSGLKIDNDWSVRVESLKSLQRLAHRCSGHPNALTALAHGFRSVRELVCAQVGDLRSSVSREACQTLHTLAEVLQDEFNAHAEHCIASTMKATYVTIQVISTAADSSIRGMIESTESGYKNVINRLIDGAKTRNQVLRLNSVCYLTLTLEQWSVPFLSKHLDIFLQILPALLHDALAEVRAQARKCFWALHRLFSQEADELFDRLDTSTQKNLRDDPARHGGNAVEVIDRALEQTRASSPQGRGLPDTRGDKKVDERVLIALIRHMADPHYRVAQAALKSLLSCLSVSSEHQVSPFLKTIMPRLFQKFIDPKESIRSLARETLEYLMSAYDASLLIGHVVQQLTDGSNMKLKAAVCHYLKSLLPGAREYIQQSPNNTNMRILLTKIAQLLEGDVPVAVSSAGSELLQVATSLFTSEVEASLPLLAPMKRATLNKVLKDRGIVLSLSNVGSSSTISSSMSVTKSTTEFAAADNNADQKSPTTANSRKRQAQSPLKASGSPVISGRMESERLSPVVVTDVHRVGATPPSSATTPDNQLSYAKLSAMSDFATMLSSGSTKSAAEQFEELLAILGDNNTVEAERISAIHKMTSFIKSETAVFWDRYFPRVLSLLLEAAGDRDVNAIRLLQRLLRAQPQYSQEYLHPILLGLLDSVTGQVDLAAHLSELTLTDVVRAAASSSSWEATLELLIRLLPTHEPPVLQVLLLLLRTALDAIIGRKANDHLSKLQSSEWSTKLLAPLVSKLQHSSSDVRKRTVDVLVAYYFASGENDVLSSFLAEHVDGTRRRLVEIFIERKKADRDRSLMDCS
ncbi:hypothetical protein Poli38472_012899 [Pythium oligandrum]|uniref:TOG domain-containing protein n=1 Tax=Pythium oligandrum TaxID=41045 RepID=A0A8K1FLX5_PYTOL|nr:hypothetical protein Poli38472_012899 [Pythium oligandrum]|eukprot:TMW64277.1 hypothetical protein Poli38472_012899 [Pythium oligandrum]